jgi:alditol oxidase
MVKAARIALNSWHLAEENGTMDKREFLKTSGVILTGSLVQRYVSAEAQAEHRTNWAGNFEYHAKNLISPNTTEEV